MYCNPYHGVQRTHPLIDPSVDALIYMLTPSEHNLDLVAIYFENAKTNLYEFKKDIVK